MSEIRKVSQKAANEHRTKLTLLIGQSEDQPQEASARLQELGAEQLRERASSQISRLVQYLLNHGVPLKKQLFIDLSSNDVTKLILAIKTVIDQLDNLEEQQAVDRTALELDQNTVLARLRQARTLEELEWLLRAHSGFKIVGSQREYDTGVLIEILGKVRTEVESYFDKNQALTVEIIKRITKKVTRTAGLREIVRDIIERQYGGERAQQFEVVGTGRYKVPYIPSLRNLGAVNQKPPNVLKSQDKHYADSSNFYTQQEDLKLQFYNDYSTQMSSAQQTLDLLCLAINKGGTEFVVNGETYKFEEEYHKLKSLVALWFDVAKRGLLDYSWSNRGKRKKIATNFIKLLPAWLENQYKTKLAEDLGMKGIADGERWKLKNAEEVKSRLELQLSAGDMVAFLTLSGSVYIVKINNSMAVGVDTITPKYQASLVATTSKTFESVLDSEIPSFFMPQVIVIKRTGVNFGELDDDSRTSPVVALAI